MFNKISNEKGATQIIVVFALTALIGASALVVDVGMAMATRIKFSNAIDAATLAGVMELPSNPTNAIAIASEYIDNNGFDSSDVTITIADENRSMSISGTLPHSFYLAPVIGINETTLSANAKAIIGPSSSASGLRPFGIDNQDFEYGQRVTLKEGGGGGSNGNFGGVAFDDRFGA